MALSVGSFPASLLWKHQWAQRSPVLKSLFLNKHWLMLSLMFSDGRCRGWPWILQGPQTVCFGCVLWSQTHLQPVLSRICSSVLLPVHAPVWICPRPKMPSQPIPRTAGHYVSHSTLGIGALPAESLLAHSQCPFHRTTPVATGSSQCVSAWLPACPALGQKPFRIKLAPTRRPQCNRASQTH